MPGKEDDIRWEQRFSNYRKALIQLQKFIDKGKLSELEQQGLIKAFEYTYELAWNVIKDYYEYQGVSGIQGSRDAFRIAFNRGLISDGEIWMEMVSDRVQTVHTYIEETARKISHAVFNVYYPLFVKLRNTLEELHSDQREG
jgi:nucleotidyltransferase substrate binding protein (TIGR01987 family)